jgi:hypothetical protein
MRNRIGVLVAVAALVAGCGGSGGGGGGVRGPSAPLPRGASLVPRSAPAFVTLNTDFSSSQWRDGLALVRTFPAGKKAVAKLFRSVDFARDVKPAFGPETDVVWLDFRHGGSNVVVITKPKDAAKLKALVNKGGGSPTYTRAYRGWTIFADSTSLLDRFQREAKGAKLADDAGFKDAIGRVEGHAAVRAYASGKRVQAELDRALERAGAPPAISEEAGTLVGLAGDASAKPSGVRVDGIATLTHAIRPNAYTAKLPEDLPAGALFYESFNHLDLVLKKTLKVVSEQKPGFEQQLSQVEAVADITLSHDIYPLLSHEGALAVYRATPVPTILFVLELKDAARAKRVLSRIVTIAELGGGRGVKTNSLVVHGVDVDELDFAGPPRTRIFAAVYGQKLAVVNDEATMRALIAGGGAKLVDDPVFTRIQKLAAMPDRTLGFVYANLRDGIPLVLELERRSGTRVTPAERANSKPFRSALFYATRDGDRYALTGFATIK